MDCESRTLLQHERLRARCLDQYGAVTSAQAMALGLSAQHLARSPDWARVRPGLYRLSGYPLEWPHDLMVAILAAGPEAWASHRAAAALHRLDGLPPGDVEITVRTGRITRNPPGVVVHRTGRMEFTDRTRIAGLPVTSVSRTLIDLGAVVDADTVERALESALRNRWTSIWLLQKRLEAVGGRGRPGTATLRRLLNSRLYEAPTGSALETRFVQLCRRFRLPPAVRQHEVTGSGRLARVDFAWPDRRVLVELEGYGWHGTPSDHRHDMRRQNVVVLARPGWIVLRYGWEDVVEHPERVSCELGDALGWPMPVSGHPSSATR